MAIAKQLSAMLPLHSFFFTLFDLKLGSEIITWFAVLNKVAGFYGLLAVFTGGTLAQLSMYLYSVASIALFAWAAKQIGDENPSKVLTYAHLYLIDHIISTLYMVFFGVTWYRYTPHDGRRVANSDAQKAILEAGLAAGHGQVDDAERARLALQVWNDEKGFSTTVLVLGWLIKIYFIAVLYSYAIHLRRGTFRALANSQQAQAAAKIPSAAGQSAPRRTANQNGYVYSHLRNSSLASNGDANGDVLWEGEHEEGSNDSPLYASSGPGREDASSSRNAQ